MGISLSRPPVAASSTSAVMSQRVFLARHGERADLADPNWLLSKPEEPYDAPLTLTGMQQAADLGVRLKRERIQTIYSSPFLRTLQTAHQVAQVLDLPVHVEPGICEGLLPRLFPNGSPRLQQPAALAQLLPRVTFQPTGVCSLPAYPETYGQAKRRCSRTAFALAEQHRGQNILLVGHGLSVEYLATSLVTQQKCSTQIPYCCLTECIAPSGSSGSWSYGVLMQTDFLTHAQDQASADAQRQQWGLDAQTAHPGENVAESDGHGQT